MTCIDDMTGPGGGGEIPRESNSKKTRDTGSADWIVSKGMLDTVKTHQKLSSSNVEQANWGLDEIKVDFKL